MRDRFENRYNAQTHSNRIGRDVYEISLLGDSEVEYQVDLIEADEWNGLFTFEFVVNVLHEELILSVQVYSFNAETETYSL